MIPFLDAIGPAVWRASWQGAILALLIGVLVRSLGARISPRGRYLIWSIVLVRLLVVVTPASPWSLFNLIDRNTELGSQQTTSIKTNPSIPGHPSTPGSTSLSEEDHETTHADSLPPEVTVTTLANRPSDADMIETPVSSTVTEPSPTSLPRWTNDFSLVRILSLVWLAGCFVYGVRLVGMTFTLYRRLSVCQLVKDTHILKVLEIVGDRMKIKNIPALLVSPDSISPCVAGTWNPRIVLPESLITESSATHLRHVLAHELAHLVRGDLWSNWLLLSARTLHWFNPLAWWLVREMQSEREAACDELAIGVLGEGNRSAYASTIVDLASRLGPSPIAPAMIGLISSARRLRDRIERLVQSPSTVPLGMPFAVSAILGISLIGLTDSMPTASAEPLLKKDEAVRAGEVTPDATEVTLRGRWLDHVDKTPMSGITVRLFKAQGKTAPIVELAKATTNQNGEFEFPGLAPSRPDDPVDPLVYVVFADAADRPLVSTGAWRGADSDKYFQRLQIPRDAITAFGKVVDARGRPVVGADIVYWFFDGRPIDGVLSAVSDNDGQFQILRIPDYKFQPNSFSFLVSHPDHPRTEVRIETLPNDITAVLPDGCKVAGTVIDRVTGKPAARTVIVAQRIEEFSETAATTNVAGEFQMVIPEGRYNFVAKRKDRVCIAITDRECLPGEKQELAFELVSGGIISGRVINTKTGKPVAVIEQGEPVAIGYYGPSEPRGKTISPLRLAFADAEGRFQLRAAPGENFPYFVNIHGDRMAWDTQQKPAVVVKEGETTAYDMLITPPVPPEEKLKPAQELVESLPRDPDARTERILVEFRKLSHTVDECELWCMLMRDLVGIGREAVPQLCDELDQTTADRSLRRLAFALRAIGDPRAVPALIRAIPRTLLPSSSDYGLIVADPGLAEFMQKHDLNAGMGGQYFDLGRPVREIFATLTELTRQKFEDDQLFGISLNPDPRREILQRRYFVKHAQRWQTWWDEHGRELTNDAKYHKVLLKTDEQPLPPATTQLGPHARLHGVITGATLSPAIQEGQHADHFCDLDTGYEPKWPAKIPRDEAKLDPKQLEDWAKDTGVDLMCVTHRAPDGTETFVLRSFGMKVWEINPRDLRNLEKLVAAGKLPEGRAVGDLLMHFDAASQKLEPDANAAFVFITREGNMGLIETTDRINRTANLNGMMQAPKGVGFHKGVKFNLKSIIP